MPISFTRDGLRRRDSANAVLIASNWFHALKIQGLSDYRAEKIANRIAFVGFEDALEKFSADAAAIHAADEHIYCVANDC